MQTWLLKMSLCLKMILKQQQSFTNNPQTSLCHSGNAEGGRCVWTSSHGQRGRLVPALHVRQHGEAQRPGPHSGWVPAVCCSHPQGNAMHNMQCCWFDYLWVRGVVSVLCVSVKAGMCPTVCQGNSSLVTGDNRLHSVFTWSSQFRMCLYLLPNYLIIIFKLRFWDFFLNTVISLVSPFILSMSSATMMETCLAVWPILAG